jgi:outer membrane lipoprotein-sorting protein
VNRRGARASGAPKKARSEVKFLRTVSTRRLLAMIAGLVVAIAGGTAIALAASSGGPVPRHEPLARAVHGALSAPNVQGISARISFTNHLIDASDIQGPSDPILQGASGRLWFSPATGQLRVELQSDSGDGQIVVNDRSFWIYDPTSNTAYEGSLPARHKEGDRHTTDAIPSVSRIRSGLSKLMERVNLSGAIPGDIAGRPAYTVRLSPKHAAGLLGDAQLAWDAARGVPLRFAIYARGESSPVVELKATDISYGTVPSSDFTVSPPSGAKIVKVSAPSGSHSHLRKGQTAERLPFTVLAPKTLVGLPRRAVTRLDWGGSPAVVVAYGRNLGGIAVLQQSASAHSKLNLGSGGRGLSLPTVSIDGVTGQELDTALGTMIRFTRGKVTYTVLGSVPPAAAELAARAL